MPNPTYCALELIDAPTPEQADYQQKLSSWLNQIWRSVVTFFVCDDEPIFWEICDRSGNTSWHLFDPVTGLATHLGSADEVRLWLEDRYSL